MRLRHMITLTLVTAMAVAPGWAATVNTGDDSVGYLPGNVSEGSINVSTATSGDSFAAVSSHTTEQVLDRLVNIAFVNADLENALRIIARQMELNIIIGPGVRGRTITLELKDVPLRFALDSILSANELGFVVERGGIVRVVPMSQLRPDPIERQTLVRRLNWQIAGDVELVLADFITEEGSLRSDAPTNSVIVSDVPGRIQEIDSLLSELDVPERQVMIEARMVDINETFARSFDAELGIGQVDDSHSDNDSSRGVAPQNTVFNSINSNYTTADGIITPADAVGFATSIVSTPRAAWSYGTRMLGYDVSLLLEAAEEEGLARVLASPRVATINNVPAEIDIQREEPYTESTFNPGGQTTQSVLFKDVGLKLTVTPRITNNGYIRMMLEPEQSIIVDFVATVNSLVPVVSRRTATTNVIVEDRHTAVLGGLRELDAINREQGTPWFRKIPVFGFLFRGDSFDRNRTDFYIFVTPEIIQTAMLGAAEQYAHDLLDLEWDVPRDYFFDDMTVEMTY